MTDGRIGPGPFRLNLTSYSLTKKQQGRSACAWRDLQKQQICCCAGFEADASAFLPTDASIAVLAGAIASAAFSADFSTSAALPPGASAPTAFPAGSRYLLQAGKTRADGAAGVPHSGSGPVAPDDPAVVAEAGLDLAAGADHCWLAARGPCGRRVSGSTIRTCCCGSRSGSL